MKYEQMRYELKREDVFGFASFISAETKEIGDELSFKRCPRCGGGRHRDEYTFSINLTSGAFCCLRGTCGYHGHFVELCRDNGYRLDFGDSREYRKLPQPAEKITPRDEAVAYLESRGISKAIIEQYEITVDKRNPKTLVFPFFDESGVLRFIKYRNTALKKGDKGSKEWSERDTMPILFGMKQCKDFSRLIITEGQIDSLSVAEAGYDNAVSVPTGANGFTWVKPCADWVNRFEEIIVFGDNENGRITLVDGIRKNFPDKPVKVVRSEDYLGEKDANDILRVFGADAVRQCIENAEPPRSRKIVRLADVAPVDLYNLDKVRTGIPTLDRTIGGLIFGQLIILTGKRGEGKSTFMSQLICACLQERRKVFAYSGELANYHFQAWIDLQLAGKTGREKITNEYGDTFPKLKRETADKIHSWYRNNLFVYDSSVVGEDYSSILSVVEIAIRDYGASVICIDNLMTAMDEVKDNSDLYLSQSNFVGRLKEIAMSYSVVVLLVAHSRKNNGNTDLNDDVSGSADITNKADIVLHYSSADDEYTDNREDGYRYSKLQITKNRLYGKRLFSEDAINLKYSESTKQITETDSAPYHYGWDKSDDSIPEMPWTI